MNKTKCPYIVIDRGGGGGRLLRPRCAVGAGLALLFAPKSGRGDPGGAQGSGAEAQGRREDRVRDAQKQLEERLEVAREGVQTRVDGVKDAVEAGRKAAVDAREELERKLERSKAAYRAGIDAARRRPQPCPPERSATASRTRKRAELAPSPRGGQRALARRRGGNSSLRGVSASRRGRRARWPWPTARTAECHPRARLPAPPLDEGAGGRRLLHGQRRGVQPPAGRHSPRSSWASGSPGTCCPPGAGSGGGHRRALVQENLPQAAGRAGPHRPPCAAVVQGVLAQRSRLHPAWAPLLFVWLATRLVGTLRTALRRDLRRRPGPGHHPGQDLRHPGGRRGRGPPHPEPGRHHRPGGGAGVRRARSSGLGRPS